MIWCSQAADLHRESPQRLMTYSIATASIRRNLKKGNIAFRRAFDHLLCRLNERRLSPAAASAGPGGFHHVATFAIDKATIEPNDRRASKCRRKLCRSCSLAPPVRRYKPTSSGLTDVSTSRRSIRSDVFSHPFRGRTGASGRKRTVPCRG